MIATSKYILRKVIGMVGQNTASYCTTGCKYHKVGTRCLMGYIKEKINGRLNLQVCYVSKIRHIGNAQSTVTTPVSVIGANKNTPTDITSHGHAHCCWRACKRWRWGEKCDMQKTRNGNGNYGQCANFQYGNREILHTPRGSRNLLPPAKHTKVAIEVDTIKVTPPDKALEGAKIKMPDDTVLFLREDAAIWEKVSTFGAKAFVLAKADDVLMSLRGKVERLKIAPQLIKEPTKEWKLPQEILTKWAAIMLEWDTETSILYGRKKKEGKPKKGESPYEWMAVVPEQEVTAGSVDVEDQAPAVSFLLRKGYQMVGSMHTHPGGMTSCSGTDTGEHWKNAGGIHIIVTRVGTTGSYYAAGGHTWRLTSDLWDYGCLWLKRPEENVKGWVKERTVVTPTGSMKLGSMISKPVYNTRTYGSYNRQNYTYGEPWQRPADHVWQRFNYKTNHMEILTKKQIKKHLKKLNAQQNLHNILVQNAPTGRPCKKCIHFKGSYHEQCKIHFTPATWDIDGDCRRWEKGHKIWDNVVAVQEWEAKNNANKRKAVTKAREEKEATVVKNAVDKDVKAVIRQVKESKKKKEVKCTSVKDALMRMIGNSTCMTEEAQEWLLGRVTEYNLIVDAIDLLQDGIDEAVLMDEMTNHLPEITLLEGKKDVLMMVLADSAVGENDNTIDVDLIGLGEI